MTDWTKRLQTPRQSQELQQLRQAVDDIARQADKAPGNTRVVFQKVTDVALVATALISGVLATVHLWKALFRQRRDERGEHVSEPTAGGREPPRHHDARRVGLNADDAERPNRQHTGHSR